MSNERPTNEIVAKLNWYLTEAPDFTGILTAAYKAANRLEDLQAQVDAVRELHRPERSGGYRYCAECESGESAAPYPCATIRALDGDES